MVTNTQVNKTPLETSMFHIATNSPDNRDVENGTNEQVNKTVLETSIFHIATNSPDSRDVKKWGQMSK